MKRSWKIVAALEKWDKEVSRIQVVSSSSMQLRGLMSAPDSSLS
ncbi:hypothetical protein [Ferrithrix thermotolerans]|nr:hypothetical protein [Ferrithrix thermotolerans]